MLRTSSKVTRERIWRRAPVRHAMWDAVRDGAEREVAVLLRVIFMASEGFSNLCTAETRLQSPWLQVCLQCSCACVLTRLSKQLKNGEPIRCKARRPLPRPFRSLPSIQPSQISTLS